MFTEVNQQPLLLLMPPFVAKAAVVGVDESQVQDCFGVYMLHASALSSSGC